MVAALALLLQAASPIPPVVINHSMVTVDADTYQKIRTDAWLNKEGAFVTTSTSSDGKRTWTGCYIYGTDSYIELFSPGPQSKEGECGVGFATPTVGGAATIYADFVASPFGKRSHLEEMNLGSPTNQLPCAHTVSYDGQDDTKLNVWLMEFRKEFYDRRQLPVGSPYKDVIDSYHRGMPNPFMLGDIQSITVRPLGDGKDLRQCLALFGYKSDSSGNDWKSADDEIIIAPPQKSKPPYAITSVRFSLVKSPKEVHVERFSAHCALTAYPDGHAEWVFN